MRLYWTKDMYEEPARLPDDPGNGYLIWPSLDGSYDPVASIRLKLIREGLEDYEYLYELRQRLEAVKQKVGWKTYNAKTRCDEFVNRIASSYKHYTTDGNKLYFTRRELAEEISQTLESPLVLLETEPSDGRYSQKKFGVIKGRVEENASVTINGEPVTVGVFGNFKMNVELDYGANDFDIRISLGDKTKSLARTLNRGTDLRWGTPLEAPEGRNLRVRRVRKGPVMDGILDDPIWRNAGMIESFSLSNGDVPEDNTNVKILYTDDALYVGFTCMESNMDDLKAEYSGRDSYVWRDDSVEVFINPDGHGLSLYQFAANVDEQVFDSRELRDDIADYEWNGDWEVRTARHRDHWTAEFRIPFSSFGLSDSPRQEEWMANFARCDRAGTLVNSSWGPTFSFHNMNALGRLSFR